MNYKEHIKQIYSELNETFERKNKDYGDSFSISVGKYGKVAALTRISDKFNRLENLMLKNNNANYESVEDTLLDLANYCIMTVAIIREENEDDE